MIRFIKQWFAIQSYVWNLSLELSRRFGKKQYYTIEDVAKCADGMKLNKVFIAYAFAIFCNRSDFESYFGSLHLKSSYDTLRAEVGRRYFEGSNKAASLMLFAKNWRRLKYYESNKA